MLPRQAFRSLVWLCVLCIVLGVLGGIPSFVEEDGEDGAYVEYGRGYQENKAMPNMKRMANPVARMSNDMAMGSGAGLDAGAAPPGMPEMIMADAMEESASSLAQAQDVAHVFNEQMEQSLQELESKTYVTSRMLIKSGRIVAQVLNLSEAVDQVTHILQQYPQGFMENISQQSNNYYGQYEYARRQSPQQHVTYLTARVPSDQFDTIMEAIQQVVGKDNVQAVDSNAHDVTDQYVDAASRADVLQASRKALQTLLDKATNVREVMDVQRELNHIVQQYESQKKRAESLKTQSVRVCVCVCVCVAPPI
jgi:hypothetical protein